MPILTHCGNTPCRVPLPDARAREIALTKKGLLRLVEEHLANESRLVEGLSRRDREALADLLAKWSASLGEAR